MATVCIDEEILHVYLVLLEIETAYGTEVVNDKRYKALIRQDTDVVPELPSMAPRSPGLRKVSHRKCFM